MQFLTPLFWLAGLALAVPVFLHLRHRHSKKSIPFSSLMFLRRIPIQERRRRRLKHPLLLVLRCLGVILLVAAFARPVLKSQWFSQANPLLSRSIVILIDHSMSMSRENVWELAVQAARQKIAQLRESDEAAIIQFGETAEVLTPWLKDPGQLLQILGQQVNPSFEGTSYLEGLRIALELLKQAGNRRQEICLITDLQQSGLNESLGWKLPPQVTLKIKDTGLESPNIYFESVRLERDVFEDVYPHSVVVRVASSPGRAAQGEVQLFLGDQLKDRQAFNLAGNGVGTVTFKSFEVPVGVSRGRFVLAVDDGFAGDNVNYFVLERQQTRQVALLSGASNLSSIYFEKAMEAGRNLPFAVVPLETSGISKLNPATAPVLIMNDVPVPPSFESVAAFLKKGGGLIISLASQVRSESYNDRLGEILPARLVKRRYVRNRSQSFTSIMDGNWQHPIFSVFQSRAKESLAEAQFYGFWELAPNPGSKVLARFTEGSPVLVEKEFQGGKVLLFASSLDRIWNDFPLRSGFVPFWFQAVKYVSEWESRPASYSVNQFLSARNFVAITSGTGPDTWNVVDPKGRRILGLDEERPDYVALKLPGYYEIRASKQTDWVAANSSSRESDFKRVSPEELRAAFAPSEPSGRIDQAGLQAPAREQEREQALWWLLLSAAILVLTLESILANRTVRGNLKLTARADER